MLLVEEAEVCGEESVGKYHVKGDEFFLQGHFPENPVVPGVILCEMMAQSACVLLAGEEKGKTPYFTSMKNVKFRKSVKPGDIFESHCRITRVKKPFYAAEGKGYVDGNLMVEAEFSFALM